MSAVRITRHRSGDGLRPIDPYRDLSELADLIELCFSDSGGPDLRSVLRDMRTMAKLGPLLGIWNGLPGVGPVMGYVWREGGRLIGNVSIFRAEAPPEIGDGWVIANVVVHPDHRRRGIARKMMNAALEYIACRGRWVALQVERGNEAALGLYRSLGFVGNGVWSLWYRPPSRLMGRLPAQDATAWPIVPMGRADWEAEYRLAGLVRPDGMGWLKPILPRYFRRSFLVGLWNLLSLHLERHWGVWDGERLAGVVILRRLMGVYSDELTLLVHPEHRGEMESHLIDFVIRRYPGRALQSEHPADDKAASMAFRNAGFRLLRTLIYMHLNL